MTGLAWRSVRARWTASLASAVSIFLGTAVVLAFAGLLATASDPRATAADREALTVTGAVVGSWALGIVLFSVASMLALGVRRRAEEFALLRTVGATRRQVRGFVLGEALVLAGGAVAAGVLPGKLLGRGVLALLQDAGLVSPAVEHRLGWLPAVGSAAAVLGTSALAALLSARAATAGSAQEGLVAGRTPRARMGRRRVAGGVVLLAVGATYSALTVTVMAHSEDPYAAMATAGPASVFWSLGLAVLSPALLRVVGGALGPVTRLGSRRVASSLAGAHVRRRAHDLAGVLMPVLVLVGIGTGTLYLMEIEDRTSTVGGVVGENIALVNYLVVGMIATFAAIMVVNGTLAAVADRRVEFAQQRRAGLTRSEILSVVARESLVVLVVATVFGGLAALGTVVPYSLVKTDGWLAVSGPGWLLGVLAVAGVVTLGTAVVATRRATAEPGGRPLLG